MNLGNKIKRAGVEKILEYLEEDPANNIPKAFDMLKKYDIKGVLSRQMDSVEHYIKDPNNNWNIYIQKLYNEIDPEVRKTILTNFIINTNITGEDKRKAAKEKYQCNIPWAILMDPTTACNLKCIGCWAADYGNKMNMDFDTLDSIIEQGKEFGTYMYIYSGGEPLTRKKDIIALCEKHSDCMFLAFTNGTLIDEEFADEMLRVKNFVPAISIEGFETATDGRRGSGVFKKVEHAMQLLNERHLVFGASCCYTSANWKSIGSEAFFDYLVDIGARFAWFFTYMPVGKDAVKELLVTPEQREFMYHQIRAYRSTKPIFTLDFWNDGEYVSGCIAGGRRYLHINANGDIEPCAFIHYSDSNIHEKTLIEAFTSPLFMGYHNNQPFNENMLRPCPALDNPEKIVKIVNESGAKSTDMQSPESVEEFTAKTVEAAEKWAKTADKLWYTEKRQRVFKP